MSKTPFMPLWVSDFLGDTLDLDATEVGAYLLLLMAQWNRNGGSLPDDSEKLKRIARCGRNWPKVWGVISRFFVSDDDGIYNARLRHEAQTVAAKRVVNSQNGARGGNAKALKTNNTIVANATISLQRNASIPEPYIKEEATNVASKKKRASRLDENWVLPATWGQWAVDEGLAPEAVRQEAAKFRDYWHSKAGPQAVKLDWQATWRNWVRQARDRSPQLKAIPGGRSEQPTRAQFDVAHREYARRLSAGEIQPRPDPSDPFAQ